MPISNVLALRVQQGGLPHQTVQCTQDLDNSLLDEIQDKLEQTNATLHKAENLCRQKYDNEVR